MPMNRDLYPDNWEAIALTVKTEAGWICEECGRPCRAPGEEFLVWIERLRTRRLTECPVIREWMDKPRRFVLTVAHLDHRPENCDRSNLRALCTVCHCRYDLRQMPRKRHLKQERLGQLRLEVGYD